MDADPRVDTMAATLTDVRATLARIEERSLHLATAAQLEQARGEVKELRGEVTGLRGEVARLPSSWLMITTIVGGQATLAALLAAVVFGVAHLLGKV
jgi:hypothetical protein